MFELIFGSFWTAIIAFMTFAFYGGFGSGGTITVNGEVVSQAEFNAMLWPKLFFAVFWIIGLIFLFKGLKKLFTNAATSVRGKQTYGCIIDIINSNCYVNENPVYNIKILIAEKNGQFGEYIESSGLNYDKYPIGSYVRVKHYKKDINIIGPAKEYDVPLKLKNYVGERYLDNTVKNNIDLGEDEIYVDGVRYVRTSSKPRSMNDYDKGTIRDTRDKRDNSNAFDV